MEKPHKKISFAAVTKVFSRLSFIFGIVWRCSRSIILFNIFSTLYAGTYPLLGALLTRNIIHILNYRGIENGSGESYRLLIVYIAAAVGLLLFNKIYHSLVSYIQYSAGSKISRTVKLMLFEKFRVVDLQSYDDSEFHNRIARANKEATDGPSKILWSILEIVGQVITMAGFVAIVFAFNPLIGLLVFISTIPIGLIELYIGEKNFQVSNETAQESRKMGYYSRIITEREIAKEIRIYDLGQRIIDLYQAAFGNYFSVCRTLFLKRSVLSFFGALFLFGVTGFAYIYLILLTFRGEMPLENFILYNTAIVSLGISTSRILQSVTGIYSFTLFIDNLRDFLNIKPQIIGSDIDGIQPVRNGGKHEIEFVDVSFRYPKAKTDVLQNVSFKIESGESASLVGLNGAGKSTIVKLMMRLYDPTEGKILLDRRDLREYKAESLYDMYAVVFQDYAKMSIDVKENIWAGDIGKPLDKEKMVAAAQKGCAHDFIMKYPKNYDAALTRIFEADGVEPSIGQWQKMAIARAFYRSAEIMILDEPSASIDAETEYKIYESIEAQKGKVTTIFISHRLSSATTTGNVIFIEDGRVVESGSHQNLLKKGGKYATLFTMQADRYIKRNAEGTETNGV